MTPLAEHIEKMRLRRDPPPSWNLMATDAGLSPSQVAQIVKGKIKRPTSDTLRKIVRRWGTPEDERELLRLAGHPAPMVDEGLTKTERLLLEMYHSMTSEQQQAGLGVLRGTRTPGEVAGMLFAEIDISTEEEDAWLADYPEQQSGGGMTLSLLNEDELFIIKRYRLMNRRGQAIMAVGLRKFHDAAMAGRSVGPVVQRQWVLMLDRLEKMPEADQRQMLGYIDRQIKGDPGVPDGGHVRLTIFERRVLNTFSHVPEKTMDVFILAMENATHPGRISRMILTALDPTPEEMAEADRIQSEVFGPAIPGFLLSDSDRTVLRRMRLFAPDVRLQAAAFQVRYPAAADSAREFVRRLEQVLEDDPGLRAQVEPSETDDWVKMRDVFAHLSPEVQHNLLTMAKALDADQQSMEAKEDEANEAANPGSLPGAAPA